MKRRRRKSKWKSKSKCNWGDLGTLGFEPQMDLGFEVIIQSWQSDYRLG
jgi:hypothetical protein